MAPAHRCAVDPVSGRKVQDDREVGDDSIRGEAVRPAHVRFGQPAPGDLICVGREEESVHEHDVTTLEGRLDLAAHELRARGHEEQCFRRRSNVTRRLEENLTDCVAHWRPSRLAQRYDWHAGGAQTIGQQSKLSRLA